MTARWSYPAVTLVLFGAGACDATRADGDADASADGGTPTFRGTQLPRAGDASVSSSVDGGQPSEDAADSPRQRDDAATVMNDLGTENPIDSSGVEFDPDATEEPTLAPVVGGIDVEDFEPCPGARRCNGECVAEGTSVTNCSHLYASVSVESLVMSDGYLVIAGSSLEDPDASLTLLHEASGEATLLSPDVSGDAKKIVVHGDRVFAWYDNAETETGSIVEVSVNDASVEVALDDLPRLADFAVASERIYFIEASPAAAIDVRYANLDGTETSPVQRFASAFVANDEFLATRNGDRLEVSRHASVDEIHTLEVPSGVSLGDVPSTLGDEFVYHNSPGQETYWRAPLDGTDDPALFEPLLLIPDDMEIEELQRSGAILSHTSSEARILFTMPLSGGPITRMGSVDSFHAFHLTDVALYVGTIGVLRLAR